MTPITPVGYVESSFQQPADPFEMMKHESVIVIKEEFAEALHNIDQSSFIDVVFLFHQSEGYSLRGLNYFQEDKGVFASRSPKRPNPIGITSVKLVKHDGCRLVVHGLDAINGTPVVDIKPTVTSFYKEHVEAITTQQTKTHPRREITGAIKANNLEYLLLEAGKIHGHFCPGLSMGVMAATYAMRHINQISDGMEDLIAIVETNNCFADGVQMVTGCSFGNNALIYKDWGKNALTLTKRNGKGIRIITKNDSRAYIQSSNPGFFEQFKKVVIEKNHDPEERSKLRAEGTKASFAMLNQDFDRIFNVMEVSVDLPEYAPIHDSIICSECGENTMATRIVKDNGSELCLSCHSKDYFQLDGHGIRNVSGK